MGFITRSRRTKVDRIMLLGIHGKSVKWEAPEKKLSDNVGNETALLPFRLYFEESFSFNLKSENIMCYVSNT